jgi:hypothetical protein
LLLPTLRIPPRLLRALLLRGVVLWFLAQLVAVAIMAAARVANGEAAALYINWNTVSLWALVMLPGLMLVDLRRRKELALLHNLGVTTHGAVIVGITPALVLEAGLLTLAR